MSVHLPDFGGPLSELDYQRLADRWIAPEQADASGLRRVDSQTGREMFARKSGDCSGILIPNRWPGDESIRENRIRLDHPDHEYRADGVLRETRKYLQPPGRRNLLYFPVGVTEEMLADPGALLIITEGEFKALALWRLAHHKTADQPHFLPVSVAGVYNWRGTIGKATGADGQRVDVKGPIPDVERIVWKGRKVVIAYDSDSEENPKVRAARNQLTIELMHRGAVVGNLMWSMQEGKGIDDRLAKIGPDKVLADILEIDFGGWRTRLIRTENGKVMSCYENAALELENSPEWKGVIAYNEFTGGYFIQKPAPPPVTAGVGEELQDQFDTEATRWLERHGVMATPTMVRKIVDAVAKRNAFHPVRDYLNALPEWDRKPRLCTWLIDYCGVPSSDSNPNEYAMQVGSKFLISAIARIFEPGCKADHMLVLEGAQGIGKSSAARILAGDWFTDQIADIGSKDASMQIRGVWIVELSELGALGRTEAAKEKAFLSQQIERFRLPYGYRIVHIARQCVFVGTTNAVTWLKDETGGRRFWPVRCGRIDLKGLSADRDQLWAETLHRYRAKEKWWLESNEVIEQATEQQSERYAEDVWQEKVMAFAEEEAGLPISQPRGSVSVSEILGRLGLETSKQDLSAANRVSRCLQSSGWVRARTGPRGQRSWRYRPTFSDNSHE